MHLVNCVISIHSVSWENYIGSDRRTNVFTPIKKNILTSSDRLTNADQVLSVLAGLLGKEIFGVVQPDTLDKHIKVAPDGGSVACNARTKLEQGTDKAVVLSLNAAKNFLPNSQKKPGEE